MNYCKRICYSSINQVRFIRKNSTMNNIIVNKEGNITVIGINRPDKRNCVNSETAEELKLAIESFENDDNSYAAVLHGVGGNFCAGYDLSELANVGNLSTDFMIETGTMGPTMRYIKKPIVAAISGYAVAGGLELALMCDLRVMEETAVMGVYCRRFGIHAYFDDHGIFFNDTTSLSEKVEKDDMVIEIRVSDKYSRKCFLKIVVREARNSLDLFVATGVPLIDGGTVRLQAMVGLSRALDFTLTGRSINAKEALECGLANRVVAVGASLGQAKNLASSLVKFPQGCLNVDRDSIYNSAYCTAYLDLLKFEREKATHIIAEESIEGAKRFMSGIGRHGKTSNLTEKPVPKWETIENENDPKSKL